MNITAKPALPLCVACAIYDAATDLNDMIKAWERLGEHYDRPRYIAVPGSREDHSIRQMRCAYDHWLINRARCA